MTLYARINNKSQTVIERLDEDANAPRGFFLSLGFINDANVNIIIDLALIEKWHETVKELNSNE